VLAKLPVDATQADTDGLEVVDGPELFRPIQMTCRVPVPPEAECRHARQVVRQGIVPVRGERRLRRRQGLLVRAPRRGFVDGAIRLLQRALRPPRVVILAGALELRARL
jgi:hypothetical protein